ncbi:MAG: hypothetical protein CVT64_02545 [Actinobacteria bacterium HGW-Actinobacteria-4]|nr:MAG: hypothetical protein CVT64_02545 [Actinobacteria bacterium HGW-Actinobacteria-4]
MQGLRQPVGDQPPEVYWKRRGILLGLIVLVFLVVWFLSTSPSGETDDPSSPAPTTSPAPDLTTSPVAGASRACGPEDVEFTTVANPRDFAGGALPNFDVDIEHVGDTPCHLDTASEGTELLIMSGSDRIWSSADCPVDTPINARQFLMQPGAAEEFQVTWPRTRSSVGCNPVSATPLPGTYRATLTIQGIPSAEAVFTLSN